MLLVILISIVDLKTFDLNLLKSFTEFIKAHQLFSFSDNLLIAVSGGLDSSVLCRLCHHAGIPFSIAHCNFQLRGEESNRDELFVTSLSEKYNVPLYLVHFDTKEFARSNKLSTQEAARKLRYDWFDDILEGKVEPVTNHPNTNTTAPVYLLTAHHLDDNIETVLMHFFKGTGISGLRGIPVKAGKTVRPLLFAYRKEIEAFAIENGLAWVNDSSNDESKYTRNYFRHHIIPAVEKIFPEVRSSIAHNIHRFSEIEELYHQAVDLQKQKLLEYKGVEIHIPVLKLQKSKPLFSIIYELISDFSFTARQVPEVIKLLNSESGKYVSSATHRILRNRKWLIISPLKTEDAQIILIEKNHQGSVVFDGQILSIEFLEQEISFSIENNIAVLDARDIQFPLILRKWKQGDYFYPLGLGKKKKLSRFFIDQKLSKPDKEKTWVIESGKKIIWIVGLRIDDRFKIGPSTNKAIKLQVNKM